MIDCQKLNFVDAVPFGLNGYLEARMGPLSLRPGRLISCESFIVRLIDLTATKFFYVDTWLR